MTLYRSSFFAVAIALLLVGFLPDFATAEEQGIADFPKLSATRDWPWWRGPQRNGVADDTEVPTRLSEQENLVWKVPVPGRGHSSPIVVGDLVILTTADEGRKAQSVLAFDRQTGESKWQTEVNKGDFPKKNHAKNTEATPTVACDGERIFATFYFHDKVEMIALDFQGEVVWRGNAGPFHPKMFEYGYAPSPVIYKEMVITSTEWDGNSFLTALNRETGKQIWRTPREKSISFSTPVITHASGKDQLVMSGVKKVSAYNPTTGTRLWATNGTTAATCGTMVWDGENLFASGGYPKAETIAVRAKDGKELWKNNQKCYEQSMLAHAGHVYALNDNGVLFCWRGEDGQEMWKQRLEGPVSASPVLADGNIYWANEMGTLYVFKATPEKFESVAENKIGDDSFPSPAICGGQIFLRAGSGQGSSRQESLYCFGKKQ